MFLAGVARNFQKLLGGNGRFPGAVSEEVSQGVGGGSEQIFDGEPYNVMYRLSVVERPS